MLYFSQRHSHLTPPHLIFRLASLSPYLVFHSASLSLTLTSPCFPPASLPLLSSFTRNSMTHTARSCCRWYVVQFRFVSFLFQPPPSFQLAPNARQRGKLQLGMFVRFSLEIAIFGLCCHTHFKFFLASLSHLTSFSLLASFSLGGSPPSYLPSLAI